jgi:nucleoid-associated protein YgaU
MQKDLKIGMIVGLVIVTVAMLWLFAGPGIGPRTIVPNMSSNQEPTPSPDTTGTKNSSETGTGDEKNNQISATDNQSQDSNTSNGEAYWKKHWQTEKIKTQRFHIIREGETLSEISSKYYGTAIKWQKILEANRDVIEDVSKLKPGTKIIIPE